MSELTEAEAVRDITTSGGWARVIGPGTVYTRPDNNGAITVFDTDEYSDYPRRKRATRIMTSSSSFASYLAEHGDKKTEVFADAKGNTIIGIIDSHGGHGLDGGWQSHKVTLVLEHTKSWNHWTLNDGKWFDQIEFAEFIEQHSTDITEPDSAELMSIAQNFYMTKGLEYESTQRLDNGETKLVYKEKVATKGLGTIEVPKQLTLALQPYIGSPRQYCHAGFRTRLHGSTLQIGYVLIRPEEILDGIFEDIVTELAEGREAVAATDKKPAVDSFGPVAAPIYFGRP